MHLRFQELVNDYPSKAFDGQFAQVLLTKKDMLSPKISNHSKAGSVFFFSNYNFLLNVPREAMRINISRHST